jgi:hypothetical protein
VLAEIAAIDATDKLYMLKIYDTWSIDSVDRAALEGDDHNLYGWVTSQSLQLYSP